MGRPAFFPAPPATDFFDISHGFGNTSLYAAFLGARFTSLTSDRLVQLSDDKLLKIPDLATDVPSQREFYEVSEARPPAYQQDAGRSPNIQGFYHVLASRLSQACTGPRIFSFVCSEEDC